MTTIASLKQQIKKLETNIEVETMFLNKQNVLLNTNLRFHDWIPITVMIGSFIFGFLFARKKTILQLLRSTLTLLFGVISLYRNIKLLLPMLFLL